MEWDDLFFYLSSFSTTVGFPFSIYSCGDLLAVHGMREMILIFVVTLLRLVFRYEFLKIFGYAK